MYNQMDILNLIIAGVIEMKKFMSFFICLVILTTAVVPIANAQNSVELNISKDDILNDVQSTVYGISADKISNVNGTDISSNLIYNNSFEHYSNEGKENLSEDYWTFSNLKHSVKNEDPMNKNNSNYEVLTVSGKGKISNLGFIEEGKKNKKSSATIGFKKGLKYNFSCYIKNVDFEGSALVYLDSPSNKNVLTEIDITNSKSHWKKISATLESSATETGTLTIEFKGKGTLQLDFVSLIPEDAYGYDKTEWKFAPIRYDVQQAISNLKPSYIRFPLIVNEDMNVDNYSWKNTVGPAEERKYTENNTSETGFGEYLTLCDELDTEAIPSLNANVSKLNETELQSYIQNIYDLIEYANGGSVQTYWGAIRAGHGHAEPYNLKVIELVGDGSDNFNKVCDKLNKKYPEIKFITSTDSKSELEKSDMSTAISYANNIALFEQGSKKEYSEPSVLLNTNSSSVSLTPSYFTQMIFSNNHGNKTINTSFTDEVKDIEKSVTINESEQAIYIKLINHKGSNQTVNLNLNGFEHINFVSQQSISSKRLNSKNKVGSPYYVAPKDTELNVKENVVTAELEKHSINVIRIAYGGNDGASLYKLPKGTPVAEDFISDPVKIIIPCGILCVIAISAVITIVVKSSKKRKNK